VRRAVVVIGYEHDPPEIELAPLFAAFEAVARDVMGFKLGERVEELRTGLVHTVHQRLRWWRGRWWAGNSASGRVARCSLAVQSGMVRHLMSPRVGKLRVPPRFMRRSVALGIRFRASF